MNDAEFKAAFLRCFGENFLPRLTLVIDTASAAIARVTVLEAHIAELELLISDIKAESEAAEAARPQMKPKK